MNYKKVGCYYILVIVILSVVWFWLERDYLGIEDSVERLMCITGTHGGYGYYLFIPSVYMLLHLLIVYDLVPIYYVESLSRIGRDRYFLNIFKRIVFLSCIYAFIFVTIQMINVWLNVDNQTLLLFEFWRTELLYFIALIEVFSFGTICYILIRLITNLSFLSIFLTILFHIGIAYFAKSDIFYRNLEISDYSRIYSGKDLCIWALMAIAGLCIIGLLYRISKFIYDKKDIL